jgi:hypothetical protein
MVSSLAIHEIQRALKDESSDIAYLVRLLQHLKKTFTTDQLMDLEQEGPGIRYTLYDDLENLAGVIANQVEYGEHGDWGDDDTLILINWIMEEL